MRCEEGARLGILLMKRRRRRKPSPEVAFIAAVAKARG
jgi:hypothetical protein